MGLFDKLKGAQQAAADALARRGQRQAAGSAAWTSSR